MALIGGRQVDKREMLAGGLFVAVGALFLLGAQAYEMGTPMRMGSGYYPALLAGLLVLLGLLIIVRGVIVGRRDGSPGEPLALEWRGAVPVLGGIAAFGLLVSGGGLYIAMPAAVGIAALGSRPIRPVAAIVTAVAMTVVSDLIFRRGLGLPIAALGSWL
jgi:hypothetical protein